MTRIRHLATSVILLVLLSIPANSQANGIGPTLSYRTLVTNGLLSLHLPTRYSSFLLSAVSGNKMSFTASSAKSILRSSQENRVVEQGVALAILYCQRADVPSLIDVFSTLSPDGQRNMIEDSLVVLPKFVRPDYVALADKALEMFALRSNLVDEADVDLTYSRTLIDYYKLTGSPSAVDEILSVASLQTVKYDQQAAFVMETAGVFKGDAIPVVRWYFASDHCVGPQNVGALADFLQKYRDPAESNSYIINKTNALKDALAAVTSADQPSK